MSAMPLGNRDMSEVLESGSVRGVLESAVLDDAHIGDIHGAFGTIRHDDLGPRANWRAHGATLLAILGPGLIVMVGDNDAGAFGTYTQAGQNYGTTLLWTLMLLIPVLYVNQEMVLRLGAVSGVGHARLILERFGKFWGAFSVIDLFLLNSLTIVTEFIGISLALDYLGLPKNTGVITSALLVMIAVSTGNFRRFERFSMFLVFGSLLLVPVIVMVHPPMLQLVRDFTVPQLPKGAPLSDVTLLIIAIVGMTVAPWQLFFQQSYVVNKRITPRFIKYEAHRSLVRYRACDDRRDCQDGICRRNLCRPSGSGKFHRCWSRCGRIGEICRQAACGPVRACPHRRCIIGAAAVSLATAYALGDVLSLRHSLHRKPAEAKGFYGVYFGLIVFAAFLVLTPGTPLGLFDQCGPNACRRFVAQRDGVPAPAM
jgi:hypothetical protein